ncbi:MAG TPA: hypothetical protein VGP27_23895 [Mycobacterium sp.]|nr:hypothetical protein [Mycobacterium sp.]
MAQTPIERLFIVEATNWKQAVISLLEPESSYTSWCCVADDAEEGDAVAFVLNTDPTSVLTGLGYVGSDGDPTQAQVELSPIAPLGLVDLETLRMITGFRWNGDPRHEWVLHGETAIRMTLALEDCRYRGDQYTRFGHNSMAAARVLLHSHGRCDGCDQRMDLHFDDAGKYVHIHTVDAYHRGRPPEGAADWPGALCARCSARMRKDGYVSLVDYRLAQHPACPSCGAQQTRRALFGLLTSRDYPPWLVARGCCVTNDDWTCWQCGLAW